MHTHPGHQSPQFVYYVRLHLSHSPLRSLPLSLCVYVYVLFTNSKCLSVFIFFWRKTRKSIAYPCCTRQCENDVRMRVGCVTRRRCWSRFVRWIRQHNEIKQTTSIRQKPLEIRNWHFLILTHTRKYLRLHKIFLLVSRYHCCLLAIVFALHIVY